MKPITKLRINHILLGTAYLIKSRWQSYVTSLLLPLSLIELLSFYEAHTQLIIPVMFVLATIDFLMKCNIAYAFHQVSLIGPSSKSWHEQLLIDREKVIFFGSMVFVMLLPLIWPIFIVKSFNHFSTLLMLIGFYLSTRISVILPARAVGKPLSLKSAWVLTKGHGMRMMLLLYVLPFFVHFLLNKQEIVNLVHYFVFLVIEVLVGATFFIVLSLIYAELTHSK